MKSTIVCMLLLLLQSSDMYYPQIDQDIEVDICQTRSVKEKNRLEKIKQDTKMGFMTTKLL